MSSPRPADRALNEPRRTVDEDGVVRLDLRPAGGVKRGFVRGVFVLAPAALLVAAGVLAWGVFNGTPSGGGAGSQGPARAVGPQKTNTSARPATPQNRDTGGPAHSSAGGPAIPAAPRGGEPGGPEGTNSGAPELAADAIEDADEGAEDMRAGDRELDPPERAGAPERTGISAFPAPGTKRIKRGLVVPEDFPLPAGYVRHYQATDKGQLLQPILMFHPDYAPLDASGNPIPLPADRVVPEDMAPPGLATEYLDIPDDAYADRESWGSDEGGGESEEGDGDSAP